MIGGFLFGLLFVTFTIGMSYIIGEKRHAAGKDLSHTKSGKMILESSAKNRARNGRNGKTTKK